MERVEKGTGEVQVLLYPWASHYRSGGEILATESWASPQTCLPRKLNILRSQAPLGTPWLHRELVSKAQGCFKHWHLLRKL